MKKFIVLVLSLFIFAGCTGATADDVADATEPENRSNATLTQEEAYKIALSSPCADEGNVLNEAYYNDYSHTWWFETDIAKEGCNPACMVREEANTAEINWMCTGLISE